MAVEYKKAKDLLDELEVEHMQRHGDLQKLRDYWHGRYWDRWTGERTGLASLFRDIARHTDNDAPDFKIVHNILQEVCLKYQAFLSPLPMIRVYVDPPESRLRRIQATRKERYLYGLWNQRPTSMNAILNRIGWYLPLMGDTFLGAFPDMEDKLIRPVLRSPEIAYPIPSYDGSTLDVVMFKWESTRSKAARQFPNYDPDATKGRFPTLKRKTQKEKVTVLEYSDGNEFARWVDTQKVEGVEHNYGFNLFDQIPFIHVPDEPWNHGAVEQIVGMNESENLLRSLMLQAVIENIFPKYVLIDPSKSPEELDMGAGAVWGVNPGGDVKTLAPPLQAVPVQQGFMAEGERAMKQAAGMADANFGNVRGSIVTGKAINEMQSAGAGNNVEMVQSVGIGTAMVSWNEKALCMGRKMFADDTINLAGFESGSAIEIHPKYFSIPVKGSELVGSFRNEVVFSPALDIHQKLVMNLQAMGAGLVSKEHSRNQLGIPDSQAMDEEILGERIQDIVIMAIEQELTAAATPDAAEDAEKRAMAYLAGSTGPALPAATAAAGVPPAAPPVGGPPAGPPTGPPTGGPPVGPLPGGGQVMSPALELPPGAPAPQGSAPPPGPPGMAPSGEQPLTLDQVVQDFQAVEGLAGRVFLVGEIVTGQTTDDVEVAVTAPADKQTITNALPAYAGRLVFHNVKDVPGEEHVEVTPGAAPEPAGEAPDFTDLLEA